MNPAYVKPVLNKLIKSYKNKKVYKFLHLPLQSGSNKILKDMGRKYSVKDFSQISKYNCSLNDWEWYDRLRIKYPLLLGIPGSVVFHSYCGLKNFIETKKFLFRLDRTLAVHCAACKIGLNLSQL